MIAIGRGQLHAPHRTITNEPDRVEEGRLSSFGPNRASRARGPAKHQQASDNS